MTTAALVPIGPADDAEHLALVLERLEDEVRVCGARYGVLVDRMGQIVASEGITDQHQLETLAAHLVQDFAPNRASPRAFREWPVNSMLKDAETTRLCSQPLGPDWLLAMGFPIDVSPLPAAQLSMRWKQRLGPLVPRRESEQMREERQRAQEIIKRDNVNLLFKDE